MCCCVDALACSDVAAVCKVTSLSDCRTVYEQGPLGRARSQENPILRVDCNSIHTQQHPTPLPPPSTSPGLNSMLHLPHGVAFNVTYRQHQTRASPLAAALFQLLQTSLAVHLVLADSQFAAQPPPTQQLVGARTAMSFIDNSSRRQLVALGDTLRGVEGPPSSSSSTCSRSSGSSSSSSSSSRKSAGCGLQGWRMLQGAGISQ